MIAANFRLISAMELLVDTPVPAPVVVVVVVGASEYWVEAPDTLRP